jgi:hypothetical protein
MILGHVIKTQNLSSSVRNDILQTARLYGDVVLTDYEQPVTIPTGLGPGNNY